MSKGLVTVVGATGTHGRAIAARLAKAGWRVRGLCRNAAGGQVDGLRATGVDVIAVNLDEPHGVNSAIAGSDAVVSIIASLQNRFDTGQATQGIHVAEAAALAGVKHFIYSSVLAPQHGIIGHGSKIAIAERIHELGLPATILRPAFFMENLLTHFPAKVENGTITVALPFPPDTTLELVAVEDIARAAEVVLGNPADYVGKSLDLVSDRRTFREMTEIISHTTGRPAVPAAIPLHALEQGWPQGVPMLKFLSKGDRHGDAAVLRQLIGTPTDFSTWVETTLAPVLGPG